MSRLRLSGRALAPGIQPVTCWLVHQLINTFIESLFHVISELVLSGPAGHTERSGPVPILSPFGYRSSGSAAAALTALQSSCGGSCCRCRVHILRGHEGLQAGSDGPGTDGLVLLETDR